MATAIEAAEQTTGKPLLWATIQFVSGGALGDDIDILVEQLGGGRSVSQVRVTLSRDGHTLQTLSAALGGRIGFSDQQFVQIPDVPPPTDCPLKEDHAFENPDNLLSQFERRTAHEYADAGTEHMWIRPISGTPVSAALLGITSDFILGAHPVSRSGTSLDNTLRIYSTIPTEWILCVTKMSGISNGTIFGVQHQFAENGTLLSTSSQTGLLPRTPNP